MIPYALVASFPIKPDGLGAVAKVDELLFRSDKSTSEFNLPLKEIRPRDVMHPILAAIDETAAHREGCSAS